MNRIDLVCDDFERAWRAGKLPEVDSYLQRAPEEDRSLLQSELRSLEQALLDEQTREINVRDGVVNSSEMESVAWEGSTYSASEEDFRSLSVVVLADVLKGGQGAGRRSRDEPLLELQRLARERTYEMGECLIRQGDQADSLIVIQDGTVEIRIDQEDGSTHVIDRAGPGQVLGEMALLTDEPRTASAIAIEPVRAAILPAESFHDIVRQHPSLSTLLTDLIASRLGNAQRDALSGKQLNRYCIRRRLGRGGMSVVYEATDAENGTRVALKMMSHRLVCSPAALRRFQLEADMIERFDHPHIVKMYGRFDAFRTYFIAMEYCVGDTLAHHLARHGAMDEAAFRRAMAQLAQALQYAHREGVVHRDIKPANVMRLDDGTLKLMDFGLAEPILGESSDDGRVVGTPRYMAPEQRIGEKVDARADYFSLGCVAYEMLTGMSLFAGTLAEEVHRDFRRWRPPDFGRFDGPLSKEAAHVIKDLLAVHPEDRGVDLQAIAAWG